MRKIFSIPVSAGKLEAHFGHCKQFAMIEVEDLEIRGISYLDAPPHQPGLLPGWLGERGVTDIIAQGMGQKARDLLNKRGVNVFTGAPVLSPEELVAGFLEGSIEFTANHCDH